MVTVAMGAANRLIGYFGGVGIASAFYLAWFVIEFEVGRPHGGSGVWFGVGFAIFYWLFEGMGAALILMALPWYLVVRAYGRIRRFGLIYFSLIGAAITLVMGSATASLAQAAVY